MGGQQHPRVMGRWETPPAPLVLQCPELPGHTPAHSVGRTQVKRSFVISVVSDFRHGVFGGK